MSCSVGGCMLGCFRSLTFWFSAGFIRGLSPDHQVRYPRTCISLIGHSSHRRQHGNNGNSWCVLHHGSIDWEKERESFVGSWKTSCNNKKKNGKGRKRIVKWDAQCKWSTHKKSSKEENDARKRKRKQRMMQGADEPKRLFAMLHKLKWSRCFRKWTCVDPSTHSYSAQPSLHNTRLFHITLVSFYIAIHFHLVSSQ